MKGSAQRHFGMDALRLIAMLMVIVLHVLGIGGVLSQLEVGSLRHKVAWLLESACFGAVNCYGLISGYVGVRAKFRYAGVAERWLQVLFYTVLPTLLFAMVRPEWADAKQIGAAFLPVSTEQYWFYTSYFCMSLFIPAMNHFLHTAPRILLVRALAAAFVLFCGIAPAMTGDYFQINMGYSPLWLGVLYLTGGYVRLYGQAEHLPAGQKVRALAVYGAASVGTWLLKLADDANVLPQAADALLARGLLQYNSPLIALGALALFAYFTAVSPGRRACRVIAWLSPAAFGVYLLHTQPVIWKHVLPGHFWALSLQRAYVLPFSVIGWALAILAVCACLDKLRGRLFAKMGVRALCKRLFAGIDADTP